MISNTFLPCRNHQLCVQEMQNKTRHYIRIGRMTPVLSGKPFLAKAINRFGITPYLNIKRQNKLYHQQICDTIYSDKELSYLASWGWNSKRGRKDIANLLCYTKESKCTGALDLVSFSCHSRATRHLHMSKEVNITMRSWIRFLSTEVIIGIWSQSIEEFNIKTVIVRIGWEKMKPIPIFQAYYHHM